MEDQAKVLVTTPVPGPDVAVAIAGAAQRVGRGNLFQLGHPKYGGRKKGVVNKRQKFAQQLAAEMKVDPVQFMLQVLNSNYIEIPVLANAVTGEVKLKPNGQPEMQKIVVPLELRMDAAKAVAPYVYPRLHATQVTGRDDGPVEIDLDIAAVLADPEAVAAAQSLSLRMAQAELDKGRE